MSFFDRDIARLCGLAGFLFFTIRKLAMLHGASATAATALALLSGGFFGACAMSWIGLLVRRQKDQRPQDRDHHDHHD